MEYLIARPAEALSQADVDRVVELMGDASGLIPLEGPRPFERPAAPVQHDWSNMSLRAFTLKEALPRLNAPGLDRAWLEIRRGVMIYAVGRSNLMTPIETNKSDPAEWLHYGPIRETIEMEYVYRVLANQPNITAQFFDAIRTLPADAHAVLRREIPELIELCDFDEVLYAVADANAGGRAVSVPHAYMLDRLHAAAVNREYNAGQILASRPYACRDLIAFDPRFAEINLVRQGAGKAERVLQALEDLQSREVDEFNLALQTLRRESLALRDVIANDPDSYDLLRFAQAIHPGLLHDGIMPTAREMDEIGIHVGRATTEIVL